MRVCEYEDENVYIYMCIYVNTCLYHAYMIIHNITQHAVHLYHLTNDANLSVICL